MIGVIILAAGASTRMGQPKQKLVYQQQTLLQLAVKAALNLNAGPVIVVLGANAELIRPDIEQESVQIVYNAEWMQGMASSIYTGIGFLQKNHEAIDSALLMLCDQPFVSTELLQELLVCRAESEAGIIACAYQETTGAPVLFDQTYFEDLLSLQGQEGAKKLLIKHADQVISVAFPEGSIDMDTMEDYQKLLKFD